MMGHNQNITIATWNACLGISNKKDLITNMINENKIDILCLQEVEIDQKIITNMMSIKNQNIEIEQNDVKSRVATYIKSTINYKRRCDLEGINNGMTIIDIELTKSFRLINKTFISGFEQ